MTLLVAGILLGVGVPNVMEFQRNGAMTAAANELVTGVLTARTEAVKRQVPVTLCASPDPDRPEPDLQPERRGRERRVHRLGRRERQLRRATAPAS